MAFEPHMVVLSTHGLFYSPHRLAGPADHSPSCMYTSGHLLSGVKFWSEIKVNLVSQLHLAAATRCVQPIAQNFTHLSMYAPHSPTAPWLSLSQEECTTIQIRPPIRFTGIASLHPNNRVSAGFDPWPWEWEGSALSTMPSTIARQIRWTTKCNDSPTRLRLT